MSSQNRLWGVPTVPLALMNGARGVVVAILSWRLPASRFRRGALPCVRRPCVLRRLAAHMVVDSQPLSELENGQWGAGPGREGELGLHTLIDYSWQITLGDKPVSVEEFRKLDVEPITDDKTQNRVPKEFEPFI